MPKGESNTERASISKKARRDLQSDAVGAAELAACTAKTLPLSDRKLGRLSEDRLLS